MSDPATCTHKHPGRYETIEVTPGDDFWGVEAEYESVWVEPSAIEDYDLHRMRCTLCGKFSYYSGRAKDHYEGKVQDDFIAKTAADYDKRKSNDNR